MAKVVGRGIVIDEVLRVLGGRAFLSDLGAEITPVVKEDRLALQWHEKQARYGITWCVVLMVNGSYAVCLGDKYEVFLEEFDLSLEQVGKVFRKALKLD